MVNGHVLFNVISWFNWFFLAFKKFILHLRDVKTAYLELLEILKTQIDFRKKNFYLQVTLILRWTR